MISDHRIFEISRIVIRDFWTIEASVNMGLRIHTTRTMAIVPLIDCGPVAEAQADNLKRALIKLAATNRHVGYVTLNPATQAEVIPADLFFSSLPPEYMCGIAIKFSELNKPVYNAGYSIVSFFSLNLQKGKVG